MHEFVDENVLRLGLSQWKVVIHVLTMIVQFRKVFLFHTIWNCRLVVVYQRKWLSVNVYLLQIQTTQLVFCFVFHAIFQDQAKKFSLHKYTRAEYFTRYVGQKPDKNFKKCSRIRFLITKYCNVTIFLTKMPPVSYDTMNFFPHGGNHLLYFVSFVRHQFRCMIYVLES